MDVVPGRAVIASKGEQALEAQTYVAKEHVYVYLSVLGGITGATRYVTLRSRVHEPCFAPNSLAWSCLAWALPGAQDVPSVIRLVDLRQCSYNGQSTLSSLYSVGCLGLYAPVEPSV